MQESLLVHVPEMGHLVSWPYEEIRVSLCLLYLLCLFV